MGDIAAPRISKTEVRDVALMACAIACGQSWVLISFHSLNLYAAIETSEYVLDSVYLISIICIGVLLLCMGLFQSFFGKLLSNVAVFWTSVAAMTFSGVLYGLATLPDILGFVFIIIGGIVSALSSGFLLVCQGMLICRMHMRDVTLSVSIGIVLSILLFAFSILLDPTLCLVFVVILAATYGVLLHTIKLNQLHGNPVKLVSLKDQHVIKNIDDTQSITQLLTRLCICTGLIGFAHELSRTIYIQIDIIEAGMATYAGLQTAGAIIATLGTILIALAMMSSNVQRMPFLCHHFVFLFLVAAALGLPLPLIGPNHTTFVEYSLAQGAQNCFSLFMWIMMSALCQRLSAMRVRIFCFIRCAWALGPLLGMLVGRYVCQHVGLSPLSAFIVMTVDVICVVVAMAFVFNEHVLQNTMGIIPIERRERFQEKCRKVIEEYGLSEREGEIMMMFAKGRNLAFIQDELCISKSTVSTHRQHIYRKLDIHSQQELLDLVQSMTI